MGLRDAAGLAACITVLYLGARSVMEIGGSCAEGGPYQIARPCPKGVAMLVASSIWVGLIFLGLYAYHTATRELPSFVGFAWPALFLSLGWNFAQFGFDPPGGGGPAWGWLLCAVFFVAMGGLPLWYLIPATIRSIREPDPVPKPRATRPSDALREARPVFSRPSPRSAEGMVALLERLDRLRRAGALDDAQFEDAKRRVLEGEEP